jgi:hypothetical protein
MIERRSRRKEIMEKIANIKRGTEIVMFQPCVRNSEEGFEYFIDGGGELYIFKNQEYVGKLKVTHKGGVSKNLYSDLNYIFGIK